MLKLENLSVFEFQNKFKSESDCYEYLMELKWANKEFECRRCGNDNACRGNGEYIKKCTRCGYQESATAHTTFHKCKFSIIKAFWIVYFVSTTKCGISSYELSRKLDLRRKTCWLFKRKIMEAMQSSESQPMEGKVEVDEFVVGQKESGVKGRKSVNKKKVVIAIERKDKGVSRIYARHIDKASKKEILPFMRTHIDKMAEVVTDGWSAYRNIEDDFPNHVVHLSEGGKNFDELHRCIMMIKAWIRGTHHSVKHLQSYLNEYCYRFNRHLMKLGIFENLMSRMMKHPPTPYSVIQYG